MIMNSTKPGLEQLDVLVGEWSMESKKYSLGRGRTTVERIEGGAFLRLVSMEENDGFPASTQIISTDDSRDECLALYHDSRGVHRVYCMAVAGGVWKMWREAPDFWQSYAGTITDGGRTIAGQWEFSKDGKHWVVDFDLTYRRIDG
jgi:hypothetical protein